MKIVRTDIELQEALDQVSDLGLVGFVPTMGALHAGHISLVKKCKEQCDYCVVSLFVNPTQFNDKNDLKNYPRTEEADSKLLASANCDILFIPSVATIYPQEDNRQFDFSPLADVMEGASRPGHFNGVGQVVSRLFDMVHPDLAFFGEKDFQQLAIIRLMTEQLSLPIEIVGCPIHRADDGLALSSRNTLLSSEQRAAAPHIYATIKKAISLKSEMSVTELKAWVTAEIDINKELVCEYFTIVDSDTLVDIDSWSTDRPLRGCIAVQVGSVRLIDNIDFQQQ